MWKRVPFRNYFLTGVIINLGLCLFLIIIKGFLPPLVPLFYGRPMGESQLTGTYGLLIAPAVSLLITVVNILLSLWVKDNFLKKLLAITSIAISVLTAITILKIVFLVGFF